MDRQLDAEKRFLIYLELYGGICSSLQCWFLCIEVSSEIHRCEINIIISTINIDPISYNIASILLDVLMITIIIIIRY